MSHERMNSPGKVAVITGGSRGLGLALANELASRGWTLVLDARDGERLAEAAGGLPAAAGGVRIIPGDVAEPVHRRELADAVATLGGVDVLVNNASVLGPSPLPPLATYPIEELRQVFEVNVVAPLALAQLLLASLAERSGRILNITSDAAVEGYPGWGGYGASKAALEQLSNVLAAEHPGLRIYRVDPGDLRTALHQDAFPGEDISDRPLPEVAVPGLLALIEGDLPSGRYRAQELAGASPAAEAEVAIR